MNILLLTYGSRGDIQPFMALAIGLQKAGHAVTLAAPFRFHDFIEQYGIHCEPLAGDPDELSRFFNDAGENAYQMVRTMQKHVFRIALPLAAWSTVRRSGLARQPCMPSSRQAAAPSF